MNTTSETSPTTSQTIRLGTRASPLAKWQAHWVAEQLRLVGASVELVYLTTRGDVVANPLSEVGGQGLFTKEIQRALLANEIDLAVHSLKDLPTAPMDGLRLAAVPQRERTGDAFVSIQFESFRQLPHGAKVGTGSLRRKAQLLHVRGDLVVEDIRGNIDTRLRKLDEGQYDAIILAEAGLLRLGLDGRIRHLLDPSWMLPAVGQGALGLETRTEDVATQSKLTQLNDPHTHACVLAERSLLASLRAGCLAPVGALANIDDGSLYLMAVVLSSNGKERIARDIKGPPERAVELGAELAEALVRDGASRLLAQRN